VRKYRWLIIGTCGAVAIAVAAVLSGLLSPANQINDTALTLAWPDSTHGLDPKPEYRDALTSTGVIEYGDDCSKLGNSCDAFVATVMRYSGVDPNFPCCGAKLLHSYLLDNGAMYEQIPNLTSTFNLKPGDILSNDGHIMIYIRRPNGTFGVASAAHCTKTADYAGDVTFSDGDGPYDIFRVIND